ncbi:hypothetical protein MMC11_005330 [Xylographa trunciseda]|nr:hypothetical protein [Xylographa trunciseda]
MDASRKRGIHDSDTETHRPPKSARQSQISSDLEIEENTDEGPPHERLPTVVISPVVEQTASDSRVTVPSLALETLQNSTYTEEYSLPGSESVASVDEYTEDALENSSRPSHDGIVFPQEISYTLDITYEEPVLLDKKLVSVVSVNEGYSCIEELAEQKVKSIDTRLGVSKELLFRHGSCKITTKDGNTELYPLTSSEHWNDVCVVLLNYWRLGKVENFHIDISREYFSLQTRKEGEKSFASIKREEIEVLMKPSLDGKEYIPRTDLERITSIDTIRQIIKEDKSLALSLQETDAFIHTVKHTARTLLAICVYSSLGMKCLKVLVDRGLRDASLPLKKSTEKCHSMGCVADFKALLICQGRFLAPVFNELGEYKKLQSGVAIPMKYHPVDKEKHAATFDHSASTKTTSISTEPETNPEKLSAYCGHGSFGNVYRVKLHPDHHRFGRNDFALKEYTDRPERAFDDFHKELKVLDELRLYTSKKHVVIHFAAWTQEGKHYLLLPYAESNLSDYMKRHVFDPTRKAKILWLLRQLRGLVGAVESVHNIQPLETTSAIGLAPAPMEAGKSGWHHDIKPENILCFREKSLGYVDLFLSDFGSGRVSVLRSGSANTHTPSGSQTYEAPDGTANNGGISRPYDVWSLGCVFLEILMWASFGYAAVKRFQDDRMDLRYPGSAHDQIQDDCFWQKDIHGRVSRRKAVEATMKRLEGEVEQQAGQPFIDVMDLLPRMLDVDPETRLKAFDLLELLKNIHKQATIDLKSIDNNAPPGPRELSGSSLRLKLRVPAQRRAPERLGLPVAGGFASLENSPTEMQRSPHAKDPSQMLSPARHSHSESYSSTIARRGSAPPSPGNRSPFHPGES